jgi:tellurite resistance protein
MEVEALAELLVWSYKRGFMDAAKSISEVIGCSADNVIDAEELKRVYIEMLKNHKQLKLTDATH